MVEPIAAIPLNDELQEARALVAKAELDVLSKLTDKILLEFESIQSLLQETIKLDKVTARAKYSIAHDGTFPDLYLPNCEKETVTSATGGSVVTTSLAHHPKKAWKLYMPNAYHPLLLQQHQESLHQAKKDVANATAEIRRRKIYGQDIADEDQLASHLESMKLRVSQLEKEHPVPVDFMIAEETTVLVITGPNTGGKTISLKTVGLASLMAKIGLYILASEPVKIPWFNAIYADIGDEQSLTQSLSTFSGHLKNIGAIRAESTSESLVLLDEVGAGTNPLEGAALGMSLLESFAEAGSFLTLATTHHGELKTLKYRFQLFQTQTSPLIMDMERFKQEYQQNLQEAQQLLMQSKVLHENLELGQKNIADHISAQRKRKARVVSEYAVMARSIIRKKFQQLQEAAIAERVIEEKAAKNVKSERVKDPEPISTSTATGKTQKTDASLVAAASGVEDGIPEVGDLVYVPKLRNQAIVVKIDLSKDELQVQAGMMKLKLKFKDVKIQKRESIPQQPDTEGVLSLVEG
ncbi:hypothetical protein PR202_gb07162 [Eleusine coracana subsp. coracana]|uniref:DNA mismatch repair proteins mutS family domain-containing protein n=1 Tax=Eleusine coracana subsp. coracana TaxID=191504 RepID=A0AAV5EBG3_ELECO|nr:hypothetical protein PR202_gb07162 [Eleusine coracana subsp. coracana]